MNGRRIPVGPSRLTGHAGVLDQIKPKFRRSWTAAAGVVDQPPARPRRAICRVTTTPIAAAASPAISAGNRLGV